MGLFEGVATNRFDIVNRVTNERVTLVERLGDGTQTEVVDTRNSKPVAKYFCAWADRFKAQSALLGQVRAESAEVGGESRGYLRRHAPYAHPHKPWLYAEAISPLTGVTERGGADHLKVAHYDWAMLEVEFEQKPYKVREDYDVMVDGHPDETTLRRYVKRQVPDRQNQVLTHRAGGWVWLDGPNNGRPVMAEIKQTIPRALVTYTWFEVPVDAVPRVFACDSMDKVNADEWDNTPAGTLKFEKFTETEPRAMPDGTLVTDVTYLFLYNGRTWFNLPDPLDDNNFHTVGLLIGEDAKYLFEEFDPAELFRPAV